MRLEAADEGRVFRIGSSAEARRIGGAEAELLAWLLGRSDGAKLSRDDPSPLPKFPSIYLT